MIVGIVGAGASGMVAALTAARAGAKVILFEGNDRVGKKILSTGNGKCNLGNLDMDKTKYASLCPDKIETYLSRFGTEDAIRFFRELGLFIISKNGYLYPKSEQAASVLDVLRFALERTSNIEILLNHKVTAIRRKKNRFILIANGSTFFADKLILACGSKAAPKTGSDGTGYQLAESLGHTIVPVVPALVQLRCQENWFKAVAGVRAEAKLTVLSSKCNISEQGELQLTDYGISGIPVFQLSRYINYLLHETSNIEIAIDFFPEMSQEELDSLILSTRRLEDYATVEEYFSGVLNKKLMAALEKIAGLSLHDQPSVIGQDRLLEVSKLCKNLRVHVTGSNSFEQAQVCAGGVSLAEVDLNLQSGLVENLYITGEMLDVDGRCGGYNLHWAWCSGRIAGLAAARKNHSDKVIEND